MNKKKIPKLKYLHVDESYSCDINVDDISDCLEKIYIGGKVINIK